MKSILHRLVSLCLLMACLFCAASQVRTLNSKTWAASLKPADTATQARVNEAYGKLPLSFEVNRGQADAPVKFLSTGINYSILFRTDEIRLSLNGAEVNDKEESGDCRAQVSRTRSSVSVKFVNANPAPQIEGTDELPGKSNYIIGSDQKNWRTGIPTYAKVRYREVWPGVDAVFYGAQQRLEYDFVVAPGTDPRAIKLTFDGATKIGVDANGDLILHLNEGELRQLKPVIYQEVNGERRMVNGRYVVKGDRVGVEIGRYDRSRELVIDPMLVYAARTLVGVAIGIDAQGAAYIAGTVDSAFSQFVRIRDISITKLSPDGAQQVYSTIIGGSDTDDTRGVAVDAAGNVYVTGITFSTDLPLNFPVSTINAGAGVCFKSVDGGATWNNSGRGLLIRPFRELSALLIDPANPSVIYAEDASSDGLLNGAGLFKSVDGGKQWTHIRFSGEEDVKPLAIAPGSPSALFVSTSKGLRKSADGGMTLSETGLNRDDIFSLIIDRNNPTNLYAITKAGAFKSSVIFKSTNGGGAWSEAISGLPAFISIKSLALDPANPSTLYVSLLDVASASDSVFKSVDRAATWAAVSAPPSGTNSLVVHPTNSTIYAGTGHGAYMSGDGGRNWEASGLSDIVVSSLVFDPINPSTIYALSGPSQVGITGSGIYKSTDAGMTWRPAGSELSKSSIGAVAIDPLNPATLYAGTTSNSEAFVLKLDPTGRNVVYATYYGGASDEQGYGIAIDTAGNAYITGLATSFQPPPLVNNVPTSGPGFMAKLNAQGANFVYSTLIPGVCRAIAVDRNGKAYVTGRSDPGFPLMAKNGFKTSPEQESLSDAFFAKLDPEKAGEDSLLYATYLGSNSFDEGRAIAVDAGGQVYVASFVPPALSFPSPERFGPIFLTKIDPSKSGAPSLVWESLIVRSGLPGGVAVDAAGDVYVVGATNIINLPVTPGAVQTDLTGGVCGRIRPCNRPPCTCTNPPKPGCPSPDEGTDIPCSDVFIMKFNAAGTALLYSTYLGNNGSDEFAASIAVDAAKNLYVTGPGRVSFTPGAFQNGGGAGFIAKLDPGMRSANAIAVSAANYRGPQLAQESLAVGFLDAFGAGSDKLGAKVNDSAGTERNAPVFFSGFGQVNLQIPPGTAIGDAVVSITSNGVAIANGALKVVKVAPGVFSLDSSGSGVVAAFVQRHKPDGSFTQESIFRFDPAQNKFIAVPIDLGPETDRVFLAIFGTGWRFRSSETSAQVKIGGVEVPVPYVGLQPSFLGLDQINVELIRTLAGKGEVDLEVSVDGIAANTTRVAFK